MYDYRGFGLHIRSEIEFPELVPCSFQTADVTIRLGKVPDGLQAPETIEMVGVAMNPEEYLLNVLRVAGYYAAHGTTVTVEPYPGADEASIRYFLLSNAMAAIVHQRDQLPLQASGIFHKDGIILLCGVTGTGKSTALKALQAKGYSVFTDEVCILPAPGPEEKTVTAIPAYPVMYLWKDSLAKLDIPAEKANRLRPHLPRYGIFYHSLFNPEPGPVRQIFLLHTSHLINETEVRKLTPLEAFREIQFTTHRYEQVNAMRKREVHFSRLSALLGSVPVIKILRPGHENTIQQMTELIESHLL